jgi:hypothetical protein
VARVCDVDGCRKPGVARGWCHAHYSRWRRYGSPTGKPEPTTKPSDARIRELREAVTKEARWWSAVILVEMMNEALG